MTDSLFRNGSQKEQGTQLGYMLETGMVSKGNNLQSSSRNKFTLVPWRIEVVEVYFETKM